MRHELRGLEPRNFARYLAALGLARVVAEQADPELRLGWDGLTFVLETSVEDLGAWMVEAYRPTPVLSPWNNGSGYGPKDKKPREFVDRIVAAPGERFSAFREIDALSREVRERESEKEAIVRSLRNWLPDEGLAWLDAAIILTSTDDKDVLQFPPLLGTGGNDGRLEFSTTFHQNLALVMPELGASRAVTQGWALDLLNGTSGQKLAPKSLGQFDAAAAGGVGGSPLDDTPSVGNPWAYVLLVEGAMMFAGSAAKRLGHGGVGRASLPFTVASSPDGPGAGASGEEVRGEVWAPVVDASPQLLDYSSWSHLFVQAKGQWGGRTPTTASQMYGAVHAHGVDRRIDRFMRFAISQRNGLAFMAELREVVQNQPAPGMDVALQLERRLGMFRRLPGLASKRALRRAESAQLAFAREPSARNLLGALAALTHVEAVGMRTPRGREAVTRGVRRPDAALSLDLLRGGEGTLQSSEWRVGAALASGRASVPGGGAWTGAPRAGAQRGVRSSTRPVRDLVIGWHDHEDHWHPPVASGLAEGDLERLLSGVAQWVATHAPNGGGDLTRGVRIAEDHGFVCAQEDLHAWVRGELDDREVAMAFTAFLAVDFGEARGRSLPAEGWFDPSLAILQAFAAGRVRDGYAEDAAGAARGVEPQWIAQLVAGTPEATTRAVAAAAGVLNRSGVWQPRGSHVETRRVAVHAPLPLVPGRRLAAALCGPSSPHPVTRWAVSDALSTDTTR
ncbi:type I-U CRISPR-associated protein Csx17 [Kytococcus schroeteri]|uniref:Type I-U CRISPR-associated protein Csx17 n=1 Tax=Kytococcus schroeteri TaxID=138300 RepID=A0A2I1PAB2_9MICO|nr:type I-U CRISPR-associated protein Csx17 [Kytococcus schroeteri]PKZ41570.1 type I-U CRISPR-associated protein Csx17 [Kytococcus schroeteri]